eukprot:7604760-Lingulodinium_polyedra.AAC.1
MPRLQSIAMWPGSPSIASLWKRFWCKGNPRAFQYYVGESLGDAVTTVAASCHRVPCGRPLLAKFLRPGAQR